MRASWIAIPLLCLASPVHSLETLAHGRLAQVRIFRPQSDAQQIVLLLSDAGGWSAVETSVALALPPYEMPPALLWEQVLANSDAGARKIIDRFGGRALEVRSVRCDAIPEKEGANTIRQDCIARLRSASDSLPAARYFGSIIERDGRYKFMGLANAL